MKIAFDVDATLTDMNGFLLRHGRAFFAKLNKPLLDQDATTVEVMFGATEEEMVSFWKRNYIRYCLGVKLKPGLKDITERLRADGHELHVVTARLFAYRQDLIGKLVRYAVKSKFKHYGIYMDSYTFTNDEVADDKLNVCRAGHFDTIVEDNPNHIEKIAGELKIPVIVVNTPENKRLDMKGLIRIDTMDELEDALKKANSLVINSQTGGNAS
ncbi:MAG: hypothetical protein K6F34_11160 [Lachnospiraceae bacterium]|nr:hypothetical protein [Lachnospiraceae bacterium]